MAKTKDIELPDCEPIPILSVALDEAVRRYGFKIIGEAKNCRMSFHAITIERRIHHPAATAITSAARALMEPA